MIPSIGNVGFDMVYIRPSTQLASTPAVKKVSESPPAANQHELVGEPIVSEYIAGVHPERRKQSDRRQEKKGAMLETRAGDRRKADKPTISVSI